ncbi:ATP-dependent RNA helicase DHH1 [Drosophila teissieri]|uniref:ATP-dependent RNA helicase DHH1 n=1 Tax=Drosophila teissieri TaxID=7243 RepID=UPI001CB9E366|nr:ATP-dependent RNA helicase DHH1 [Drosophila teissieri]
MFRFIHLDILVSLFGCFALMRAQHHQQSHQQELSGLQLHHPPWLYSMPWRPLILPTASPLPSLAALAQLSPGYTGPQTFPPVAEDQRQYPQQTQQYQQQQQYQQLQQYQPYQQHQQQQYQQTYPQQFQHPSVLVGLFTPQLQAPPLAAPPPQAGHFSLPFRPSPFAGYTDDGDGDVDQGQGYNGIQEQSAQQELEEAPFHDHAYNKPVAEGSEQPRGYVYLAPSNAYNLVRT